MKTTEKTDVKRISFNASPEDIEKLKAIAKQNSLRLQDLNVQVVRYFVKHYEERFGQVDCSDTKRRTPTILPD